MRSPVRMRTSWVRSQPRGIRRTRRRRRPRCVQRSSSCVAGWRGGGACDPRARHVRAAVRASDRSPRRCGRDARARRRDPRARADASPLARPRGSLRTCVGASSASERAQTSSRTRVPRGRFAVRAQGERLPPTRRPSIATRSIERSRRSRPRPRSCSTPSRGSWRARGARRGTRRVPLRSGAGEMRAMADAVAEALIELQSAVSRTHPRTRPRGRWRLPGDSPRCRPRLAPGTSGACSTMRSTRRGAPSSTPAPATSPTSRAAGSSTARWRT